MTQEELYYLIGKKLAGDISEQEVESLNKELEANAEYQDIYSDLENKWRASAGMFSSFNPDPEESWDAFEDSLVKNIPFYKSTSFILRIAAMLVVGLGLGYFLLTSDMTETPLATYITGPGETKEIVLSDSSHIWLNAQSSLVVDGDFGSSERNVRLSGEAFFDIQRDAAKPFVITSLNTKVEVLGTSFNVRAYKNEDEVEVNVATGVVAFSGLTTTSNRLVLEKGSRGIFHKERNDLTAYADQSSNFLAWRMKRLEFDDVELSTVVADLEEYFNTQITIKNPALSECKFTGTFKNPKLDEILEILRITLNLTTRETNAGYELDGNGCAK